MQLLWKLNCYQIFPSTICIARQIWNPENASKQSDKHVVFQYWHKRGKTVKREALKVSFVISRWILSDTVALWKAMMGQKRPKCPDKFVLLVREWSNYGPPTAECWIYVPGTEWVWSGVLPLLTKYVCRKITRDVNAWKHYLKYFFFALPQLPWPAVSHAANHN